MAWPLESGDYCQQHCSLTTPLHPDCPNLPGTFSGSPFQSLVPRRLHAQTGADVQPFQGPQPHCSFQSQRSPQKSDCFPFQSLELKTKTKQIRQNKTKENYNNQKQKNPIPLLSLILELPMHYPPSTHLFPRVATWSVLPP